jgi:hypothetical protein
VDFGAAGDCRIDITYNAAFWGKKPALFLVEGQNVLGQAVAGEASVQFEAGEHLVVDTHLDDRAKRAFEDPGVGGAGVDRADFVEQVFAAGAFDLFPELVGAAQQQDIGGVFVVGEADDACVAV